MMEDMHDSDGDGPSSYFLFKLTHNFVSSCLVDAEKVCVSVVLGVLSALCLLVACLLLICRRCKMRDRNSGDAAGYALYSFVGNLCSAVGATLSKQLKFQIAVAAFMVALDIVNFISIISPFCLCFKSKKGKRLRIVSKRRRQNLLAASFLFIMGGGVYMGMSAQHLPTDKPPSRRKLLGVFLNHHAEFLGYALGLLSFAINWTARFPSFLKARRGEMNSAVHMSSGVLCVLAGALYSTAVVLHDQQLGFILRAMPWLLAAACCAVLDLSILFLSCYSVHQKPPYVRPLGSEMESLLRNSSHCAKNKPKGKAINKPLAQSNTYKMTDMGQYMDVNVQPGRKVCLKEVRISQDGQLACQTVKRTERVIRVDGPYSSNSSSDTSTLNSELEWDFEEANQQWIKNNKVSRDAEPAEAFPLQEWVTSPQAEADPRSGSHICLCNRARLAERMVSREPLDLSLTVSDSAK